MGNKISTSIVNIMAQIMTADNAEVGMYAKCGVRNAHAQRIMRAVTQPANGDLTPDAAWMADLPKEAVTGIEPIKDPTNWHTPKATISWEASIVAPGSNWKKVKSEIKIKMSLSRNFCTQKLHIVKVVVTFYLRLRNDSSHFPPKTRPLIGWPAGSAN